jgi:uncharacterized RDD family membrane protein YckC
MAEKSKEIPYADLSDRLIAAILDNILLGILLGSLFGLSASISWSGGLGLLATFAYHWFCWTRRNGQTLGKQFMNIRVVKVDGSEISNVDAAIRFVGYMVNNLFFIGWLWAIFDSQNRGWHDIFAKTIVVKR